LDLEKESHPKSNKDEVFEGGHVGFHHSVLRFSDAFLYKKPGNK
jgi:hypothetical protein